MDQKYDNDDAAPRLSWGAILGLRDSAGLDGGAIRASQIAALHGSTGVRFLANVVGVVLLTLVLRNHTDLLLLYGWGISTLLLATHTAVGKWRLRGWNDRSATRAELHKETAAAALTGVLWGFPALLFSTAGALEQTLALWAVLTALMAGAAFVLTSIPLATVSFLLIVGGALGTWMWRIDLPVLAVAAGLNTLMLLVTASLNGRQFANSRVAELQLAEKKEVVSLLLREFEDSGADWLWQIDAGRCLTHVSPRFATALGLDLTELEGKPFLQVLAGDSWEAGNFASGLRELAEKLKRRESFSDLILPVKIDGETRWWELSASPRLDDRGTFLGFRGVGSDVTQQRDSADKINRLARYDTLTGLPNRMLINETVARAMQDAEQWRSRCAFMMIDLDRFKAVNDTLGHPVGDRLLSHVAERLRSLMSDNELCGRLGGDEFAVVVRDASDPSRLEALARNIIETLSRPYEVDQHTLYIGASVGTAVGPKDGRTAEMLIRSADLALYRSKDAGGGAHHRYEPQFHADAEERRTLEIALRSALEKGELHLVFQPVVSAKDTTIEAFETLLRWTHPTLGSIPPYKFVPVAEDARLIAPIGEWVLRAACAEAANWPSTVRVAVNVSPEQLNDPNFVTSVISALSHSGLPPHRLELEVTESIFLREGTGAINVLDQILGLGVRLALDDFGTGYSSLGYLRKTQFSTIKIDRSFVQGAAKNSAESLAIIRAVVAMADSLGMSTTAEGAETEEEFEMIRQLGCRKVQGYLFGKPMPAEEARQLLAKASRSRAAA
ncbi:putative bifunctional diguanylate cyclase/phosphodiesterase [Sphingomonas cavernae]|uniref:EAL domain-containing protein n=1 Tax=Sphingomonas cavernae TaxID=2320861 RepID=A0A418W6H2_9SPHN|nr:GGDEF and EAL domain-containing protein [Sphingomonas cavernae]RJF85633.1 EAL domain-containing protein [Sphingomonas cavernae]